ncbi:MAG: hypothetical protein E7Z77_02445 [Methanobrevibacter sp.]|uniref:hypothetical protein n=1 Tax=Methanobrevibacter sp. TaxID=66852 RepID=UPI0025E10202|nr:hypothetical protein [Methanobrevibacter sp.]MBE6508254.1 hypothetical protein [Methanobrevibacter sp.]
MWIDVDEVKTFTGINPKHLKLNDSDETKLNEILEEWILQSESLIKSYTNNQFTEDILPAAVKNVCLRLTANMVALAIERRDTPRTKVTDWTIRVSSSDIFTSDLKEDLEPYVKDYSNKSDKIEFFAITGD